METKKKQSMYINEIGHIIYQKQINLKKKNII